MPARLVLLAVTLVMMPVNAADPDVPQTDVDFSNWYQVDVVIFKPRTASVDDESWPVISPVYPANTTAVTGASIFKLSQLEQAGPLVDLAISDDQPVAAADEFAFGPRSSRIRNQQVINSVSGTANVDRADATRRGDDFSREAVASSDPIQAASIQDQIAALLAEQNPLSPGQLAFSDTTSRSTLTSIHRSLGRSSQYVVLANLSWLQPIDQASVPVLVQVGARYDDRFEVEGTLSLSRTRFLHVDTDLWYSVFERRSDADSPYRVDNAVSFSAEEEAAYPDLVQVERERGEFYVTGIHVMRQSRRMRSDELHYIDHPLFGIVIRVNRFNAGPGSP